MWMSQQFIDVALSKLLTILWELPLPAHPIVDLWDQVLLVLPPEIGLLPASLTLGHCP